MSKNIKILIAALSAMLVGAILFGIALFLGGKLNREEVTDVTHTVAEDFSSISAALGVGDLILMPSDNGTAYAVCGESEHIKYRLKVENGKLILEEVDSRPWFQFIGFFFGEREVTLYLPKTSYASLQIKNAAGSIVSRDKSLSFGNVTLETASGDITFSGKVTDSLTIDSASGNIRLTDIRADRTSIEAASGKIEIENAVSEALSASTASGDISIGSLSASNIDLDTASGDVMLRAVTTARKTQIETASGSVSLTGTDAGEYDIETASGSVTATLLSDKQFHVHSTSGSIDIPPSVKSCGICRIETASGSIYVRIAE